MLRAIPLPDESLCSLKAKNHDPVFDFQLRMKLLELDILLDMDGPEKLMNCWKIEDLLMNGDWPKC